MSAAEWRLGAKLISTSILGYGEHNVTVTVEIYWPCSQALPLALEVTKSWRAGLRKRLEIYNSDQI